MLTFTAYRKSAWLYVVKISAYKGTRRKKSYVCFFLKLENCSLYLSTRASIGGHCAMALWNHWFHWRRPCACWLFCSSRKWVGPVSHSESSSPCVHNRMLSRRPCDELAVQSGPKLEKQHFRGSVHKLCEYWPHHNPWCWILQETNKVLWKPLVQVGFLE